MLAPDFALEIDCHHISQVFPRAPFLKGYVVIESDVELDVVAVYTAGQVDSAILSSFHTERVQPRQVPVCADLILPLHTGIAAWQTVAPTAGALGPVVAIGPAPFWAPPPAGSIWVSQSVTDGGNANAGVRNYELCFELCHGFTFPRRFEIQVLADDRGDIFLNGSHIGSTPVPGFAAPTPVIVDTSLLRAGRNCFRVDVTTEPTPVENPTGFALAGILRVIGGKCPGSIAPLPAS